jgi:murein DD-endopeptidase MepM/ murein hydrolase activator NlpD
MAVWAILLVQATSFLMNNAGYTRTYPVKEIAKPSCKADHRSKLPQECKIALPVIAKANYAAYTDNQLMRLVYSVLRGGTYSDGWANTKGSHEWVDISSSEWTPIYAIGDGIAIRAGAAAWYGNLVTLKHTLPNGTTIQSIYGHLETVAIQVGDKVIEWQLIGTMGHEWFAQGNHLHFAINTTKDYTYTFNGCLDYPKTSDYAIVEQGLCRELLFSRTIDPIAFIEFQGLVPTVTSKIVTKAIAIRKPATKPTAQVTNTKPILTTTTIISAPQSTGPLATFIPSKTKASEAFLKKWTVTATPNFAGSLKKWSTTTVSINVVGLDGKKFAGVRDKEITMTPSKQNITLSPRVIRYVSEGKVISFVEARDAGTSDVVLSYGNDVIGTMKIVIE